MPLNDASAPRAGRPAPLVLGALLCLAGAALWVARPLNEALFLALDALGPRAPAIWSALTVAGLGSVAWIIVCAARPDETRTAARLLWGLVVGGLVVHGLKHLLDTPRPLGLLGPDVVHVTGEMLKAGSMPSGHSATAAALATLMVAEIGFTTRRAAWQSAAWLALGILVCLSRPAVGAHWPSDMLLGAGIGILVARLSLSPLAWPAPALARALATSWGRRFSGMLALAALWEPFDATRAHHYTDARWFAWVLVPLAAWAALSRWRVTREAASTAPADA